MNEENFYQGIYAVEAKYVMKATCRENGCFSYVPRDGLAYYLQRNANENLKKLPLSFVKDYGTHYQELATDLPIAKGKHDNVPLFIDENAEIEPIDEKKALVFISKSHNYCENFFKLYASGANAITEKQLHLENRKRKNQKIKSRHQTT